MHFRKYLSSFGLLAGASLMFGGCLAQDPDSSGQASEGKSNTMATAAIIAPGTETWTWNKKNVIALGNDIGCATLAAGKVWITGRTTGGSASWLQKWDGNLAFTKSLGTASDVDVGADGRAWFISGGLIYQVSADGKTAFPRGNGNDIGVGANGSVYKIGTNPVGTGADYGVWKYNAGNDSWTAMNGGGVRIDVDPTGKAWIVNSLGDIWKMKDVGTSFDQVTGIKARDISIGGAMGSIYAVSNEPYGTSGDFKLYHMVGTNTWKVTNGGGVRVSVDYTNKPWLVIKNGAVYQAK